MMDFKFKKKFGQNFISDKNLLNAIVNDAGIGAGDCVLEIGAGAGSLTTVLSERAKKVVAFEIDKDLQENLLSLGLKNVEFIFEDFLKFDISKLKLKNFKVVANLPYYITTPIIFKLLEEGKGIQSLTIMVQKEVAERIISNPGGKDYGILSVMIQLYGDAKIVRNIGRNMFYPAPNVDSALLHIEIKPKFEDVDRVQFFKFVQTCFAMRRKTLFNNLAAKYDKEFLRKTLSEETLKKRAEEFSLEEFVGIFKSLQK